MIVYRSLVLVPKEKYISGKYALTTLANSHFIYDISHSNGKISFLLRSNSWIIRTILPTKVQLKTVAQDENIGFAIECRSSKGLNCFLIIYFSLALFF